MTNPRLSKYTLGVILLSGQTQAEDSVARLWNEHCLAAIRRDFPAPTVHARNLFHSSAAMYDAWAAYDDTAVGVFHNESATAEDLQAARHEAIIYAAYWVLRSRYSRAIGEEETIAELTARMTEFGYPVTSASVVGTTPQVVGNRCAAAIIQGQRNDGSNELQDYQGLDGYLPINQPLILQNSGTGPLVNPNRWQPLAFDVAFTQNGQIASKVQIFIGSHWGDVTPFALTGNIDPGPPPFLGGVGDQEFKDNNVEVIRFSSHLDPTTSGDIDISPASLGDNPLGTNNGTGYSYNPIALEPYTPNIVNHADFGRVVAEFWADGPSSETPPGHWNAIANEVSDDPRLEKKFRGTGPVLDDLEWDIKLYLALNGALHDAAIAAWWNKEKYDYVRPITSIRYLAGLGQSSDPGGPLYHSGGIPLEPDLVEAVTVETAAVGQRHEGLTPNSIAIRTWQGEPNDPETEFGGVGWIAARNWLPYQRDTFVTPAFAGYVSGHSAFSRAAAEVLTAFTGSPFFPGGLGTHTVEAGHLEFEYGPSAEVQLQWATYFDAADQAGISRLYGGIHVAPDDGPGRIIGSEVGIGAFNKALQYINGSVLENFSCTASPSPEGMTITWPCLPGYEYQVQSSTNLDPASFTTLSPVETYEGTNASFLDTENSLTRKFYRVIRVNP